MNDRDTLILALAASARRLRFNAMLRELAWMACALAVAFALYQILDAAIRVAAVEGALSILLMVLLAGSAGVFAMRAWRPLALEEVAALIDRHAGLKDELKTAYWFAREHEASPLMALQIKRAAVSAQRIDAKEIFPLALPRAALALAFAAGLLSLFTPQFADLPAAREASGARAPATNSGAAAPAQPGGPAQVAPAAALDSERSPVPGARKTHTAWAKLDASIDALGAGDEFKDLAAAIGDRDAARSAQLLEELERKRAFSRAQSDARGIANSAPASADLIARLQALFSPDVNAAQSALADNADEELSRALYLARQLDDERRTPERNNPVSHDLQEGANPLQAAIALERFGPREARRAQGQGGEFAGTTDVEGGAMGRRVTQSNIGAGGKPSNSDSNISNNIEAEPVAGARTMRLAAQLKQVKIQSSQSGAGDTQGIADTGFAPTRTQQAQHDYQDARHDARYVTESTVNAERVPLAYRGAVKEYFLNLNQSEP